MVCKELIWNSREPIYGWFKEAELFNLFLSWSTPVNLLQHFFTQGMMSLRWLRIRRFPLLAFNRWTKGEEIRMRRNHFFVQGRRYTNWAIRGWDFIKLRRNKSIERSNPAASLLLILQNEAFITCSLYVNTVQLSNLMTLSYLASNYCYVIAKMKCWH